MNHPTLGLHPTLREGMPSQHPLWPTSGQRLVKFRICAKLLAGSDWGKSLSTCKLEDGLRLYMYVFVAPPRSWHTQKHVFFMYVGDQQSYYEKNVEAECHRLIHGTTAYTKLLRLCFPQHHLTANDLYMQIVDFVCVFLHEW